MPRELRETGIGGTAGTRTGVAIKMRIFGEDVSLNPEQEQEEHIWQKKLQHLQEVVSGAW